MILNWIHNIFYLQKLVFVGILLTLVFSVSAQIEKKDIHQGNKAYDSKSYNIAEKNYLHALEKNNNSTTAMFNLGDAYYKQNKFSEAAEQFQMITHKPLSKDTLSKAYHNLGNALLKDKKYENAIDAYKQALKNNSTDEDSRYNLAYAQQMLKKEQQQNQNDKNKDNKDNKDNKKDQDKDKNKKDDKENKDKNEDKKNDKSDDKNKDNKEQQPQQNQLSKEDAQRLLDALLNDEKKLQESKKVNKIKGQKNTIEKDW